ncbi:unnamed protein product [Brachionus calyciflorus]|uniref:N-acetyltransferase domain-containing protein n=1 Tax=Brachionus calyciflorus TaxID=104777 RepID=A0A813TA11_9BILA|nr:unnamed protein product [Brachionus calyciflorus]
MSTFIKEEPLELDEYNDINTNSNQIISNENETYIDKKFESELHYLQSMSNNILGNSNLSMELLEDIEMFEKLPNIEPLIHKQNEISISDIVSKINLNKIHVEKPVKQNENSKKIENQNDFLKQQKELIALEKKKILHSLIEKENSHMDSKINKYESMNLDEEEKLLKKLNKYLENKSVQDSQLARLRAKLNIRKLKRKNHVKIFDIDSYVNELIDQEKASLLNLVKQNKIKPELNHNFMDINNYELDSDIIFESASLQTSDNLEIIEVSRVLDRFKSKKTKFHHHEITMYDVQPRIGLVEARNDDIKCLISPYTNQVLKPYVWKDYFSLPPKLKINKEIIEKFDNKFEHGSIDYVHLRPEHVIPINFMCRQHFWTGIDISECLEYPDYSIVALYKKLIIGFAFLVPEPSHKEAYLSFILVHPDWRNVKSQDKDKNVSVAQYMLYYLIQKCSDCDILLHVSVNSPVVVFYQKFGFEICEFIKNFYDKYYSDEQNLSKDAFLMRLAKN